MNIDVIEKQLALISKKVPEGRHTVIVVDGAAWHQNHLTDKFDNLSIIKLPPYSPELNPIEQFGNGCAKMNSPIDVSRAMTILLMSAVELGIALYRMSLE